MSETRDLVIIGAGPGGYVAAIRAAQLGLDVTVVERDRPGGVCLNWGCIPSKNLIHQAGVFHSLHEMEAVGVGIERDGLDYAAVQQRSRDVVGTLTGGVSSLLKKNGVEYVKAAATIREPGVVGLSTGETLQASNILLATGSRPMEIPGFEFDEEVVLSSTGILDMKALPESMIILGAGAIGCEFAWVMNSFGVRVTLVELMEHLLPTEDFETCQVLSACFERDGIEVRTGTRASSLERNERGIAVTLRATSGDEEIVAADKALVVFGRTPNTDGLGLEEAGIELDERGFVVTGSYGQTSVEGIYAIGDITATPALAHVASREGEIAVEHIAGHSPVEDQVDKTLVPSAIYCEPQVAGFGLREDDAIREGIEIKKSVFRYPGAGKSIAVGKPDGIIKVVCDPKTDEIIGAHIVGHDATELIHELLLARRSELLPEDIAGMIHAHPTISEAVMESVRGINGQPVHA